MEEVNSPDNLKLLAYENGKPQPKEIKAAALLFTPAPVESLRDELGCLSDLGPHFQAINMGILMELEDDSAADQLRVALLRFGKPMHDASRDMRDAFAAARVFYMHDMDFAQRKAPPSITHERVSRLLAADFQEQAVVLAREAMNLAAQAARTIRTLALPALPQLKTDLDDYVASYAARSTVREERQRSWMPSLLQDVIWGAIDPLPWKITEVKALPQHLSIGSELLPHLPVFLDHLELHFRRLSEVTTEQLVEHGYTSYEDLIRLCQDRVLCDYILSNMTSRWHPASVAFRFGGSA